MKKILFFLLCIFLSCSPVQGKSASQKKIYENQLKMSGAENLSQSLPKEATNILAKIGLKNISPESITKIDIQKIFDEIAKSSQEKFKTVFSPISSIVGILVLCAAIKNFCPQKNESQIDRITNCICCLGLCKYVICPIVQRLAQAKLIISNAANFTTALSAVMVGIMTSSGEIITASSYHYIVLTSGEILEKIFSGIIIPILGAMFGVSVVSSISAQYTLEQFCKTFHKTVQFFLKFISGVFVGILTVQNLITSSADKVGSEGTKLMLSGCVPIVGGAISDAFETVHGCLNLIKSTVGAFGIIAGAAIFLPILTECVLWVIFLNLCKFLSDTFGLQKQSLLFDSIAQTAKTLIAILVCTAVVLISSAGIILMMGG